MGFCAARKSRASACYGSWSRVGALKVAFADLELWCRQSIRPRCFLTKEHTRGAEQLPRKEGATSAPLLTVRRVDGASGLACMRISTPALSRVRIVVTPVRDRRGLGPAVRPRPSSLSHPALPLIPLRGFQRISGFTCRNLLSVAFVSSVTRTRRDSSQSRQAHEILRRPLLILGVS